MGRNEAVRAKCSSRAIFAAALGFPPLLLSAVFWVEFASLPLYPTPKGYYPDYYTLHLGPWAGLVFPFGIIMWVMSVYFESERHYERSRRADARQRLDTLKRETLAEGKKYAKERRRQ